MSAFMEEKNEDYTENYREYTECDLDTTPKIQRSQFLSHTGDSAFEYYTHKAATAFSPCKLTRNGPSLL